MDPIHPRITQIISMPTSPRFHAPLHPLHSASFNSCQPPMTEALCRTLLALCHTLLTLCHTLCTLSHSWHFVTLLALCHTLGTLLHSWHFAICLARLTALYLQILPTLAPLSLGTLNTARLSVGVGDQCLSYLVTHSPTHNVKCVLPYLYGHLTHFHFLSSHTHTHTHTHTRPHTHTHTHIHTHTHTHTHITHTYTARFSVGVGHRCLSYAACRVGPENELQHPGHQQAHGLSAAQVG